MKSLGLRLLLSASSVLAFGASAIAQPGGKVLPLNRYACDQFATSSPEDGKKIVRSLIVMAWASGRSGPHGKISALPNEDALTRMSAAVRTACKKAPQTPVMKVIWEQIDKTN